MSILIIKLNYFLIFSSLFFDYHFALNSEKLRLIRKRNGNIINNHGISGMVGNFNNAKIGNIGSSSSVNTENFEKNLDKKIESFTNSILNNIFTNRESQDDESWIITDKANLNGNIGNFQNSLVNGLVMNGVSNVTPKSFINAPSSTITSFMIVSNNKPSSNSNGNIINNSNISGNVGNFQNSIINGQVWSGSSNANVGSFLSFTTSPSITSVILGTTNQNKNVNIVNNSNISGNVGNFENSIINGQVWSGSSTGNSGSFFSSSTTTTTTTTTATIASSIFWPTTKQNTNVNIINNSNLSGNVGNFQNSIINGQVWPGPSSINTGSFSTTTTTTTTSKQNPNVNIINNANINGNVDSFENTIVSGVSSYKSPNMLVGDFLNSLKSNPTMTTTSTSVLPTTRPASNTNSNIFNNTNINGIVGNFPNVIINGQVWPGSSTSASSIFLPTTKVNIINNSNINGLVGNFENSIINGMVWPGSSSGSAGSFPSFTTTTPTSASSITTKVNVINNNNINGLVGNFQNTIVTGTNSFKSPPVVIGDFLKFLFKNNKYSTSSTTVLPPTIFVSSTTTPISVVSASNSNGNLINNSFMNGFVGNFANSVINGVRFDSAGNIVNNTDNNGNVGSTFLSNVIIIDKKIYNGSNVMIGNTMGKPSNLKPVLTISNSPNSFVNSAFIVKKN